MSSPIPAAADALFAATRDGKVDADLLNGEAVPDNGLEWQLEVLARWQAAGETLGGWKVGLTSRGGRDSMGEGFRPFGFILARQIFASGSKIETREGTSHAVEPEFCFTIGADLSGDVGVAEVEQAISAVAPAFEIIEHRMAKGAPEALRLADRLGQWGIVVGDESPLGTVDLSEVDVQLWRDDQQLGAVRADGAIVDDHFVSIARVCAELARHGRSLEAGQRVITGSILAGRKVAAGEGELTARFVGLGEVSVSFA